MPGARPAIPRSVGYGAAGEMISPSMAPNSPFPPALRAALAPCLAVLLAVALLSGCTSRPVRIRTGPGTGITPPTGHRTEGVASWYGPGYHRKRTSSGERYDQDGITAAHPDWAFGLRVRVTMLKNGKSVVVRITDRMPRRPDRIIDLSKGAARKIGLIGPGTSRVALEVLP